MSLTVRPTPSVAGATTSLAASAFSLLSPKALVPTVGYWFSSGARRSIMAVLENGITTGSLEIHDRGESYYIGTPKKGGNHVVLEVVSPAFWSALLVSGDLGFCESFMVGDVKVNDLSKFFQLYIDNEAGMSGLSSIVNRVTSTVSSYSITLFGQTLAQSRMNVVASYDQGNPLFQAMLSPEMMYSCALFSDEEGGPTGDANSPTAATDLANAQRRKLRHVLRSARVKPGDRILEFGSGWGGLAIEAATTFGCEVDTLTLSKEQKALAEERIRAAGLEGKIRVHLMDYRKCPPEFEKAFDAFISIEMVEHVGAKYYETYFQVIDWALKSSGATAVVTSSTYPECRFTTYQPDDFCRRYMFPNGNIPSATSLITAAYTGAGGRFTVSGVENHSAHYPRTLRTWWRNLQANLRPSLFNLPDSCLTGTTPADLEARKNFETIARKWEYHTEYAGTGFVKGYITNHMLTFVRENDHLVEFA